MMQTSKGKERLEMRRQNGKARSYLTEKMSSLSCKGKFPPGAPLTPEMAADVVTLAYPPHITYTACNHTAVQSRLQKK